MKDYIIQGETLTDIASAVKEKTNDSNPMMVKEIAGKIRSIGTGIELPELDNEGTAADMIAGKQLISGEGSVVTGTIPTKTSSDLSVNGPSVTVPSGYYDSEATVSVATGSARMPATSITKAPTITVDDSGLITASVSGTKSVVPRITEGYVTEGTAGTITVKCSATEQLTTQAAKTVTPSTSAQTAVASGVYTTGAVTVEGDTNLKAENIAEGISIFGVNGTHSGGGASVETCTVSLMAAMYRYYCIVYQDGVITTVAGFGGQPTIVNVVCGSVMTIEAISGEASTFNGCTVLKEIYDSGNYYYVYVVRIDASAGGQVTIAP